MENVITRSIIKSKSDFLIKIKMLCCLLLIGNMVQSQEQGERADHLRGTWHITFKADSHYNGRVENISIEPFLDQVKDLKTVNSVAIWLGGSATKSGVYSAPHQLLESFWEGDTDANGNPLNLVVPRWGSGEEPLNDPFKDWATAIIDAGFKVKVYMNSANLVGPNVAAISDIDERWKAWCDTNPEAQAFIDSQPYHTGIWDGTSYVDASETHPNRKYFFCYAEYVIKEYAERYGHLISSWIFDSAQDINQQGDVFYSGLVEEQRVYEAFANAVHAGNPNIPIAFQNGRSTINYFASPFQKPTRFDDFTFGHAFGGNNNHANKVGTQFNNNYRHIQRMTETNGNVFEGGDNTWDDQIVGNFHSKLSTTAWAGGNVQAWEEADFLQWNEEAITVGGSMTWGIPHISNHATNNNFNMEMRGWALTLIQVLDEHLAYNIFSEEPQWARQRTTLSTAYFGEAYTHTLEEGVDFWDPENEGIESLLVVDGETPSWLTIEETEPGVWTLSGDPIETTPTDYEFTLQVNDATSGADRVVGLNVVENEGPKWKGEETLLPAAYLGNPYTHYLVEGQDFWDAEGDAIASVAVVSEDDSPSWLTIEETEPGVWMLSGIPTEIATTDFNFRLQLKNSPESIGTDRYVDLMVYGNVPPEWTGEETILPSAQIGQPYAHALVDDIDFSDNNGDAITSVEVVSEDDAPSWLIIEETEPGIWGLSGVPDEELPTNYEFSIRVSDAALGTERLIALNVLAAPTTLNAEIKATETTNYGVNTVATMYSEINTAPDGLATFKVSVDVTPPTGQAIISGISGGDGTVNSWGIGDGTDSGLDVTFLGSDNDWVESINNIQIVDFNANGSTLAVEDIIMVFKSITIVNSQSGNDFVSLSVDDVISNPGRSANRTQVIDLESATSVSDITDFAVGVGGNTLATNKWSIEGLTVLIDFEGNGLSVSDLTRTDSELKLFPNPATDKITLSLEPVEIQIFEITGKIVKTDIQGQTEVDISDLSKGVYFIKVKTSEGGIWFKKFIKK